MLANHRDAGQENSLELPALPASLTVTAARSLKCPRDGVIVFGDLVGKLDVLRVACTECKRAYCCAYFLNGAVERTRRAIHKSAANIELLNSRLTLFVLCFCAL